MGIIKLTRGGQVEMMNAKATQLLMPLAKRASLENLFEVLDHLAPKLRSQLAAFAPLRGMVLERTIRWRSAALMGSGRPPSSR